MILRVVMLAALLVALGVAAVVERRRSALLVAREASEAFRVLPEYRALVEAYGVSVAAVGTALVPAVREVARAFGEFGRSVASASAAMAEFGEAYFQGHPLDEEFPS